MSPIGPKRQIAFSQLTVAFGGEADIDRFWRALHMLRMTQSVGKQINLLRCDRATSVRRSHPLRPLVWAKAGP